MPWPGHYTIAVKTPAVSVLMAVHDGATTVARAAESILSQTFADFEFLIIDDGSEDGTPEVLAGLRDSRVKVVRGEHAGLPGALNAGLRHARGAWVARQDDDDVSLPERLARQMELVTRRPDTVLVGTDFEFASTAGECLRTGRPPRTDLGIAWTLLFRNVFSHGCAMFRREAAQAIGGYAPLRRSQDYDLWCRLSRVGRTGVVPEVLYRWTQDPEGLSGRTGKGLQDRIAAEISRGHLRGAMGGRLGDEEAESLRSLGNGREWEVPQAVALATSVRLYALKRAILHWREFSAEERRWLSREVRRRVGKLLVRSRPGLLPSALRVVAMDPMSSFRIAAETLRLLYRGADAAARGANPAGGTLGGERGR